MEYHQKIARGEWALLGMTGLFLCLLLGLFLHDRKTLDIPFAVEVERTVPIEVIRPDPSPLNLNTAAAEELAALPGIGETLAQRIVNYREEHGPFQMEEDLTKVPGIGEGKFAALEGLVTVEDSE